MDYECRATKRAIGTSGVGSKSNGSGCNSSGRATVFRY